MHVECGTQSLAGAVHNAAKGRIPVFIFAGTSPFTQEGELPGSRNEFIQWIQDVFDQRGIVRGYMKYDNELRIGAEREADRASRDAVRAQRPEGAGLSRRRARGDGAARSDPRRRRSGGGRADRAAAAAGAKASPRSLAALRAAHRPLVVTSYLGRNPAAVARARALCRRARHRRARIGAELRQLPAPTIRSTRATSGTSRTRTRRWPRPTSSWSSTATCPGFRRSAGRPPMRVIFHIDVDPLKQQMPLWYIRRARRSAPMPRRRCGQLNAHARPGSPGRHATRPPPCALGSTARERRHCRARGARSSRRRRITPEYLTACVRRADRREHASSSTRASPTTMAIIDHLRLTRPGAMFVSGGGSLGWNGGAAIGAKLARPIGRSWR